MDTDCDGIYTKHCSSECHCGDVAEQITWEEALAAMDSVPEIEYLTDSEDHGSESDMSVNVGSTFLSG